MKSLLKNRLNNSTRRSVVKLINYKFCGMGSNPGKEEIFTGAWLMVAKGVVQSLRVLNRNLVSVDTKLQDWVFLGWSLFQHKR